MSLMCSMWKIPKNTSVHLMQSLTNQLNAIGLQSHRYDPIANGWKNACPHKFKFQLCGYLVFSA